MLCALRCCGSVSPWLLRTTDNGEQIFGLPWLARFVDKIIRKHNVYPDEVEEVLSSEPTIRKVEKGDVKGENLYVAFGKTSGGRPLAVLFVRKKE